MLLPVFSDVIGHQKVKEVLTHAVRQPGSGYLFSGPDGVGKRTVALRFVRALLDQPEGVSLESHPDFIRVIREEGTKDISIERVREVIKRMQMTSARGGRRVALIEQADQLNESGVNALLKVVEEPSPGVVFLFITEQPDAIPATLRSRLISISFSRVSEADLLPWINGIEPDPDRRARIRQVAQGCPGLAQRYVADPDGWDARVSDAERLISVLQTATTGVQCGTLERMARRMESEEDVEAAWRQSLLFCMHALGSSFREQPRVASELALGLLHAWRLAGTTLSPRLALEWARVRPFYPSERTLSSFLSSSYL